VPACLCERFSFRIRISRAFIRSARRIKKILRKELVDVVDFLSLRQVAEFAESEELEESLGGDVESIAARLTFRIDCQKLPLRELREQSSAGTLANLIDLAA